MDWQLKRVNRAVKIKKLLKDVLIGEEIDGKGGFANLLKIKNSYYGLAIDQIFDEINDDPSVTSHSYDELSNFLYTFFNRYLSESGSVYYCNTPHWQNIYEKVYSATADVSLFWKTNMLYYVKSDVNYENVELKLSEQNKYYRVKIDLDDLAQKSSNELSNLVVSFDRKTVDNIYILKAEKSTRGRKTKLEDISKNSGLPIEVVKKAISHFTKQARVDYFINKDARTFLTEQLDMFLYQNLMDTKNIFQQERLNQYKNIKKYALKIIDAISKFEDELTLIWNKPKFVKGSDYVISLDRLTAEVCDDIQGSHGFDRQVQEWLEFGMIDEEEIDNFNLKEKKRAGAKLPIDTCYFSDVKCLILKSLGNLSEKIDGTLISSENYQALNTLKIKYGNKVDLIYLDPPFNTGKDFSYIDKFQDSTWLTLMNDRLMFAPTYLKENGSMWLHLDENANLYGKHLIENYFNDITEIIFDTNATKDEEADLFGYKSFGDNFQLKHQTLFYGRNEESYKFNKLWKPNRNTTNLNIGWLDLISKPKSGKKANKISDNNYYIEKWIDGSLEYVEINISDEKIFPVGDIWNDIFSFTQSEMRVSESFSFTSSQKPENLLRRIIQSSTDKGDLVLDYFLGIGTSIATAHKLNRKWIGVEMGDYISDWYFDGETKKLGVKGRMKYVLYGDQVIAKLNRRPHLSKDINWCGGGIFKYYSLEQYEETLKNSSYREAQFGRADQIDYLFNSSEKLTNLISVEDNKIVFNENILKGIDLAETISLLNGMDISYIDTEKTVLTSDNKSLEILHNVNNMSNAEKYNLLEILGPCIWWETK